MHDHHGDARLQGVEGFDVFGGAKFPQFFIGLFGGVVGGKAIGDFPTVAEIVQVVEDGEAGGPEDSPEKADLCYLSIGGAGLLLDQFVGAAGEHDGEMMFYAQFYVFFHEFGGCVDGAHMGIEVCRLETHGAGAVQLCFHFRSDFVGAGVLGDLQDRLPEVACAVGQAGYGAAAGEGAPAVIIPFGGEGQVEAGIDIGMGSQPFNEAGDPGAGHHDAHGGGGSFGKGGDGAFIGFQGHAGVVDVDDEDAGAFGEAEAFGVG